MSRFFLRTELLVLLYALFTSLVHLISLVALSLNRIDISGQRLAALFLLALFVDVVPLTYNNLFAPTSHPYLRTILATMVSYFRQGNKYDYIVVHLMVFFGKKTDSHNSQSTLSHDGRTVATRSNHPILAPDELCLLCTHLLCGAGCVDSRTLLAKGTTTHRVHDQGSPTLATLV